MQSIPVLILVLCIGLPAQQVVDSHTTESLRGISVPSKDVAWASGTHGTFLRSTDGGKTWQVAQVPGAEALDFRDVEAFGSDVAYLLAAGPGEQSRIYKTTDAGKNWNLQFTNKEPKGFFDCMTFWDRDHGIAVGDPVNGKFELITTADGGATWKPIASDRLPSAIEGEGAFAASGTCIAVQGTKHVWFATGGKAARVFRSTDAGKTWSVSDTPIVHGPDSAGIFSIAFRDANHGVVAGGDYKQPDKNGANMAVSNDGGVNWEIAPLSPQWYFSAAAFLSDSHTAIRIRSHKRTPSVLVAGSAHAALANDLGKKSWTTVWDLNLNAIAVDPYFGAIAVGPKGLIVRFTPPLQITSSHQIPGGSGYR